MLTEIEEDLYSVQPAMAMIYGELKVIVARSVLTQDAREKAHEMLQQIKEQSRLIASDLPEEHIEGECNCHKAIDSAEKLAAFLRAQVQI